MTKALPAPLSAVGVEITEALDPCDSRWLFPTGGKGMLTGPALGDATRAYQARTLRIVPCPCCKYWKTDRCSVLITAALWGFCIEAVTFPSEPYDQGKGVVSTRSPRNSNRVAGKKTQERLGKKRPDSFRFFFTIFYGNARCRDIVQRRNCTVVQINVSDFIAQSQFVATFVV
jgi:hypothetical protein